MIKEINTYYSTVTNANYNSLVAAINAEKEEKHKKASALAEKFRAILSEYKSEIADIERTQTCLQQKLESTHSKYDGVLNAIAEELNKLGIDVSNIAPESGCSVRRPQVVKVHKVSL